MTYERRQGAQVDRLVPRIDDPPAEAGKVLIYSRPVNGTMRTLARFPNGTILIIL